MRTTQDVTKADILRILSTYFVPLFHPSTSLIALACAPGKLSDISAGFTGEGWSVSERTLGNGVDEDDDSEMESGSESSGSEDEDMTTASESESEKE